MSQRTPATGPPTSLPQLAPILPAPSVTDTANPLRHEHEGGDRGHGPSSMLRPSQRGSTFPIPPSEPSLFRSPGVHNILNPTQQEAQNVEAREGAPAGASSSPTGGRKPEGLSRVPTGYSPQVLKRTLGISSATGSPSGLASSGLRPLLTPKSPTTRAASLHRTRSIGSLPAHIHESNSVPSESRIYTAEPGQHKGSEIPPLPIAPQSARPHFTYPNLAERSPEQTRRASGGRGMPSVTGPQSDSPNMSQSSYSQYSQASPVPRYGNISSRPQYQHGSARHQSSLPPGSSVTALVEAQQDLGQSSSYMTLPDTGSGSMVLSVEVDRQQASRLADEKRKRNAGASARFRQRRKEKEREASHTISSLEKEIRDLADDRDFYINERNFFRDLAARSIHPGQLPHRPPSPGRRRTTVQSGQSLSMHSSPSQWQDVGRSDDEASQRHTRRRTSGYQPPYGGPPSAPGTIPPQSQSFTPVGHGPLPNFQPSFPDHRSASNLTMTGGPSPISAPPRSTTYDPFRRDSYDRRWNPGQ